MANGGRIDFTVGFKTDKSGLIEIRKQLNDLSKLSYSSIKDMNPGMGMKEAASAAQKLRIAIDQIKPALDSAFNTKTGIVNLEKLKKSLNQLDLKDIQQRFNAIGPQGQAAFNNITKSIFTANVQLKQTSNFLDKIGTTLINTLKWNISSSLINRFTGVFQEAYGYVQHLDTSLNDIRIVTGKSADEMDRFAINANKAAKDLGKATTDYTEASLIYFQQGLGDEEVKARTETTLKAANVTGQSTSEVSEQLTAVWNGYQISAENTEVAVDKLAAVAATTAADLEELSTGMSKVAAAANSMGVDMDQLNATIATIESVTRQAPESVGTAMKTIYARMGDLKLGDTDEDGLSLGEVSGTLQKVGIEILDVNGELRDMGDVIEEIGGKWDNWTKAEQTAIAEAVAGKRQYNNLFALFENWDMYTEALETSRESQGTLQKQQDIHMESTAAHIQQLKTEWEDLYDSILDTKDINSLIDGLTRVLNLITNILDSLGGGKTLLLGIVSLVSTKFSKQIAQAFSPILMNKKNEAYNQSVLNTLQKNIDLQVKQKEVSGAAADMMSQKNAQMSQFWNLMTEDEFNASQSIIREMGDIATETERLKQRREEYEKWIQARGKEKSITSSGDYLNTGSSKQKAALTDIDEQKKKVEELKARYQDLMEQVEEFNTGGKKSARALEELQEIKDETKSIQKELEKIKNQDIISEEEIDKATKGLDKVNKKANALSKNVRSAKVDENDNLIIKQGFTKAMTKELEKTGTVIDETSSKLNEFEDVVQNGNVKIEENDQKMESLNETLQINKLAVEQATQGFSQLLGATTSLAFGFQSLSNIGNIWTDDNLSGWQKFLQITTTLGFGLGSIITGFKGLSTGIKAVKTNMLALLPVEISEAVVQGIINNLNNGQILSLAKEAGLHEVNADKIRKENGEYLAQILLKKGDKEATDELRKGVLQYFKGLNPFKDLSTKIADAGGGIKGFFSVIKTEGGAAFSGLAESIGVSTVALGAFAAALVAIPIIIAVVKKRCEDFRKTQKSIIERSNEIQDSVKSNLELIDSYNQLYEEYKETGKISEEFKTVTENLTDSLNLQDEAVLTLANDYDGLAESVKKAKEEELKKGRDSAEREKSAAAGLLKDSAIQGLLNSRDIGGRTFQINIPVGFTVDEKEAEGIVGDALDGIANDFQSSSSGILAVDYATGFTGMSTISLDYDPETIVKAYNALSQAQQDMEDAGLQNSETYQGISNWLEQVSGSVDDYIQASEDFETYATELSGLSIDEQDIVNIDSYKQQREELIQKIKEETGIEDDNRAANLADTWLSKNLTGDAKDYAQQFNAATELYEQYSQQIEGLTEEKVQEFISGMANDNTFKYQQYFTEEDWKNILGAGSFEEAQTYIREAISNHAELIREDMQKVAGIYSDSMSSLIDKVSSGDLNFSNIADDEEYKALSEDLDRLLVQFPELSDEANVFLNEGMVGSEEWAEAAYKIKDAYDKLEFENLNQKVKDAYKELQEIDINVDAKTDDFVDAVEELLDAEYAVDVKLYTDGIEEFEDAERALNDIDDMASKIGEDFIVAADDIRELNNTFPGILEGMTYLADGTVQLNEDIAKSAMDAASAEELSSTDATATKLENTAAELRAKADMYDKMSEIAADAANGTVKLEEAKDEIIQQLDEVQADNNEEVTNTEIQNSHAVVDDSAENAPILAENWTKSYQDASIAANEWAEVATAANRAVANGDTEWSNKGDFKVNFSKGRTAQTNQQIKSADIRNYDENQMQDLSETFKNMANSYRQQANDAEGAAAELRAKALKSVDINNNAGIKKDEESGSDSSSSSKDAEHEEYLERETDLYRKINMELDDIEKTLGRIQKIESHEWGIDYQKSLEEENDLLDKQLDKLKQKKAIQEQDLSIRRKQLEDVGVSFNAEGSVMNNAEETLNSLYANYNAMAAKYNAMSAEQQERFKATLETEKDRIEKIENKMSEYESTFSDYQSTLDSLLEAHYAEIENEVKKFNNMVEVHLELSEAEREWNDFWYDVVQDVDDDDFAKQIEKSFGKLDSLILGTDNDVSVLTGHLNDTVTEVEALIASANRGGEDSLFGDDTAAAKENLEDYRDKLMKALTEAKEEVDNISENYIKMLEHAQDLIDDQVDGWESIGDHLEHNMELIKLISGDKAFDALDKQYEKQYQNNLNLINAQKQSQDFWAGEIERYKQLLEVTDKNTVQWKTYSEALEKASENYKQAIEDLDKTVEEALKNLEDWRKNQSDAIMDAIDKAMSGGLGLDLVEQEWKLINDQADKYLDNVQRAYSMEEYANELDKAANATGLSATNQAKLNAFREQELAQLREKDKLTKYDIEESRARLAILQQQLALEDAQRNKSNMRLRRDSQGNYTYQYTADENAVDEAEGGLLNAKKEWYELVKARRKETNDWIIEAEKNLASILAQIDEAEKAGDVDRLNKLKDMELLIRQEVQDAYAEAGKNIQDIYNGVAIYFADVNNAAILPENAAVVSQLIKDWAGEGEESFLGAVKKALIDITGLQEEFGRKTEAILEEAGINYTKLKEKGIDPVDESLEDLQMDNEDLAIALEDVNDQLTTQEGNLRQVEAAYYSLQSAAVSAIQSANAALVALARTAVQTQMQVAAAVAAARNAAAITGSYSSNYSGNSKGAGGGDGTKGLGSRLTNNTDQGRQKYTITRVTDYYNGGKAGYVVYDNEIGATVHTTNGQTDGRIYNASGTNFSNYLDKDELERLKKVTFATGGYTGSWPDSSGKLAVLHQKELVLNESDTKNILGAVEAIRALDFNGVAKSLVQSANIQAQVLASVGESVLQALNVNQGDSVSNYRNVTVNADFSGVRSADAIYQALMELENTGMQTSFAN